MYDNDIFLLLLDDDLFWEEEPCTSTMNQTPSEAEQLTAQ